MYVYHGTAGVAGAYLHGLAQALPDLADLDWKMAASRYYAFPVGSNAHRFHGCFFSLTENTDRNPWLRWLRPPFTRLVLRYAELWFGYARSLVRLVLDDVDVVNLSVIDDELPTFLFAWSIKALGKTLCVTAHDVLMEGPRVSIKRRRRVLALADYVFVHYDHVREALCERLGVHRHRVVVHPFPWAEVTPSLDSALLATHGRTVRADLAPFTRVFLFLGVMRPEKGLETLVEAWAKVRPPPGERWGLVIAGRSTPGCNADEARRLPQTVVYDRYLTSEEFVTVLSAADVVVLPYRVPWYAHSSVRLMAALAQKPVIASRIPLFEELVGSDSGLLFEPGCSEDLARALVQLGRLPNSTLAAMGNAAMVRLVHSWKDLPRALAAAYEVVRRERR